MENLERLVIELCKQPSETPWLEFKHNNYKPEMIGQDISALANSAALYDKQTSYMIWGVDDNSHEIVGTELIKPLDPDTAPRYMKYVPVWA